MAEAAFATVCQRYLPQDVGLAILGRGLAVATAVALATGAGRKTAHLDPILCSTS